MQIWKSYNSTLRKGIMCLLGSEQVITPFSCVWTLNQTQSFVPMVSNCGNPLKLNAKETAKSSGKNILKKKSLTGSFITLLINISAASTQYAYLIKRSTGTCKSNGLQA